MNRNNFKSMSTDELWTLHGEIATRLAAALTAEKKWLLAATFKNDDAVAAPPFEVHTFKLDVLWLPEE